MQNDVDKFKLVLGEFGETLGIAELALDESGFCCLLFDDRIDLNMQLDPDTGSILLFAQLGRVQDDKRLEMYETMLAANLFWKDTGGGTISLEKSTQTVMLSLRHPLAGIQSAQFQTLLAAFVDVVEAWMDKLEKIAPSEDAARPVDMMREHIIRG